jgi:hypothetical protein
MIKELIYKITKPDPAKFTSFNQIPVNRKGDSRKDEYFSTTMFVIGCYADHPKHSIHMPLDYLCEWFTLDWADSIDISNSRATPPIKQEIINERRARILNIYLDWVKARQAEGYILQGVPHLEYKWERRWSGYP